MVTPLIVKLVLLTAGTDVAETVSVTNTLAYYVTGDSDSSAIVIKSTCHFNTHMPVKEEGKTDNVRQ